MKQSYSTMDLRHRRPGQTPQDPTQTRPIKAPTQWENRLLHGIYHYPLIIGTRGLIVPPKKPVPQEELDLSTNCSSSKVLLEKYKIIMGYPDGSANTMSNQQKILLNITPG